MVLVEQGSYSQLGVGTTSGSSPLCVSHRMSFCRNSLWLKCKFTVNVYKCLYLLTLINFRAFKPHLEIALSIFGGNIVGFFKFMEIKVQVVILDECNWITVFYRVCTDTVETAGCLKVTRLISMDWSWSSSKWRSLDEEPCLRLPPALRSMPMFQIKMLHINLSWCLLSLSTM